MIHIVTDSAAQFTKPLYVKQHPVTILPNKLTIGDKVYREGEDIPHERALDAIARQGTPPTLTTPSVEEYAALYAQLARTHEAIISIHASREMYSNWQNASLAAQQIDKVHVVDSQVTCVALGMLVQVALQAVDAGKSADEVVRIVRGAAERVFSMYYVETVDYLHHHHILTPSHSILGAMLGVKPLLGLENGRLVPTEKMKTRVQGVERLVEFAVEFTDVEDAVIVQPKTTATEYTRQLQERLALDFPDRTFPVMVYSASLGALIGTDALGIVILEEEMPDYDY
ncbi:MAG: DegV family protein [Anaerolineae bacterium]